MKKRCRNCLCRTCIMNCHCLECERKIKECKEYNDFRQISIFEPPPKQTGTPRHPIEYYGLTNERVAELVKLMQSGRYASLASQAAHRACKEYGEYILLSVMKNLSYEGLEKLWARGDIERIPCGRSDFYGWRRYFFSIFDKELRRIGK